MARSSKNKTSKLGLSQFIATDKPKWIEDYNEDMKDIDTAVAAKLNISDLLNKVYPVGSIYQSTNDTNPNSLFGGTWENFGGGRVLVGSGTSDTTYNAGNTGGATSHKHNLGDSGYAKLNINTTTGDVWHRQLYYSPWTETNVLRSTGTNVSTSSSTSTTGIGLGGSSDNSNGMPPYIVVYRWRRTG